MKIHYNPQNILGVRNPVVTVGTFDGVHIGHHNILKHLEKIAIETSGEEMLVTFDPHPRIALKKDENNLKLLNTLDEKAELLEKQGIKHLVVITFSSEFSKLSEQEFILEYLIKRLHVRRLVVGYNHRFGHGRQGDFKSLVEFGSQHGFMVDEIPACEFENIAVSSTQIRNALYVGNLKSANNMLGHYYFLSGKVIHGENIGQTLGFPTANIVCENPHKLIPSRGVYAIRVIFDGNIYSGMCNIGIKPTFDGKTEAIELHIFNFDGELYGKLLKVFFLERLRDEIRFETKELLVNQLHIDRQRAMEILAGYKDEV